MKVTVQVVTLSEDGQESMREVACVERADLTPATLGLSLAEGKTILQAIQEVVVEWQMQAYLSQQRHCPQCGHLRHSKGAHHTVFRTVFGALPVESPRLTHCACQAHNTHSFSPLAALLPEHTTPELLYLETKWAALTSYGTSVKLLQDVLPLDEPLQAVTIRNHVFTLAERLEDALGDEHVSFIDGYPRDWGALPIPDGPLTVGIDGGYVKAQGSEQGWFEVIAGKSILAFRRDDEHSAPSSKCFAFVQTYDEKPKRRLFDLLQSQGLQMNQQIEFLSDGSDTVRDLQLYLMKALQEVRRPDEPPERLGKRARPTPAGTLRLAPASASRSLRHRPNWPRPTPLVYAAAWPDESLAPRRPWAPLAARQRPNGRLAV
jgi:hypothetical protein